jgi:hypothetical protein
MDLFPLEPVKIVLAGIFAGFLPVLVIIRRGQTAVLDRLVFTVGALLGFLALPAAAYYGALFLVMSGSTGIAPLHQTVSLTFGCWLLAVVLVDMVIFIAMLVRRVLSRPS